MRETHTKTFRSITNVSVAEGDIIVATDDGRLWQYISNRRREEWHELKPIPGTFAHYQEQNPEIYEEEGPTCAEEACDKEAANGDIYCSGHQEESLTR